MKMMKVTVSGSFKTEIFTDKNRQQYADVKGIIPADEWEWHVTHAIRMFPMWLAEDARYKGINYEGIIKIRVDNVEEVESEPICLHKNIKEMSWEELMSLACYKKLRDIPHYKKGDIRRAREVAYREYEEKVNGKRIFTSVKELESFKKRMLEKEHTEGEIQLLINNALNMVETPDRPETSYNFVKLPDLYVDGRAKSEPSPERSTIKGSDK